MALPALKHIAKLEYGDALAKEVRTVGDVPVFGSNGVDGFHDTANTLAPAIIIGRKGSFGKVTWTDSPGFCIDTAYYIDRRSTKANLRWLFWALQTLGLDAHSQDTGVPGLSREKAYQTRVRVPSLGEQERIAQFLDDQTERIDALVAEKAKLLSSLADLNEAAVNETVLGVDIATRGERLKGLEVLGALPAAWWSSRMKYEVDYVTSGSRGWADFYSEDGPLFIRIGNLTRNSIALDMSDIQRVQPPASAEGARARVVPGDLLISITAYLGSVAVAPETIELAYVSQHVALARPTRLRTIPRWLGYVVLSTVGRTFFDLEGYGGTKIQLSLDDIRELPVPVPPLEVQVKRIGELENRLKRLFELREHVWAHVSRLREYRSSLISAAVTGQLGISTANATASLIA